MPLAFCVATSNPWQRSTARTRLARQRRRSRTTPTRRPTRRRAATPRRLPTLRRDTGSVRCECSLTIRLAGDGCRHCQPQTYIDSLEMCAEDNLRTIEQLQSERAEQARLLDAGGERELALMARIDALEAARFAYASEFPSNEDGDPDVGSIHQNIRALKDRLAQVDRKTAGQPKSCRSTEQLQVIQEALRLLPSDEARRVAREAEAGSGAVTPAQYVGAGAVAVLANAWLEKAANLCFDPQDAERIRALRTKPKRAMRNCQLAKLRNSQRRLAQKLKASAARSTPACFAPRAAPCWTTSRAPPPKRLWTHAARRLPLTPCSVEPAWSVSLSRMARTCGRCAEMAVASVLTAIGATSRCQAAARTNGSRGIASRLYKRPSTLPGGRRARHADNSTPQQEPARPFRWPFPAGSIGERS